MTPVIVEKYADNGAHSHWSIIDVDADSETIVEDLTELKRETEWISVEDELPENDQKVMCFDSDCNHIGIYRNHGNLNFKAAFTHWMPLPQPPEPAQEELCSK